MLLKRIKLLLICSFYIKLVVSIKIDFTSSAYVSSLKSDARYKSKQSPNSIAIVGGGIGGTSSAYFLRTLFGDKTDIVIYESSHKLCGRVATVNVANRNYESGASIIHAKNMYAKVAAQTFGLKNGNSLDQISSFFDGENYVLKTSRWLIITMLKFLWNFGFDFFSLSWLEKNFMDQFLNIYPLHAKGHSYSSVKNLLEAVTSSSQFVNATEITSCRLFEEYGLHNSIITSLVNSGLRNNYGQNCNVNGFVGMVSMAGIQPDLWSIDGGNDLLCKELVEHSNVQLINEEVTKISPALNGKFSVITKVSSSEKFYDLVVVATPINQDMSHIDVTEVCTTKGSCPSAITDKRHYRSTVATFVKGKLNSTLFQCDSLSSCPGIIFTTAELFYRSVSLHSPVDFNPQKGDSIKDGVYKVFSTDPLTSDQLSLLFENQTAKAEVPWRAYPYYSPPDKLDSFVLNEAGVYYTSPIEWAASAIEMSMISAKNVALLAFNNWFGIDDNVDSNLQKSGHSEL